MIDYIQFNIIIMKDTILTIFYGLLILIFVALPIIAFIIKLYKMPFKRYSRGVPEPPITLRKTNETNKFEKISFNAQEDYPKRRIIAEELNNDMLQAMAVPDMLNVADTNSTFSHFENSSRGFDDGFGGGGFSGSGAGSSWDSNSDSNSYGSDSLSNSGID